MGNDYRLKKSGVFLTVHESQEYNYRKFFPLFDSIFKIQPKEWRDDF